MRIITEFIILLPCLDYGGSIHVSFVFLETSPIQTFSSTET